MTIENILKNIITSIEDDSFEIYDVIMEFARQNQHIYIDLLHEFKNDENPFQQLDSKLEKQISSICSDLGYIDEAIEAEKLKNFIIQRNITHLCHFTRLENLESILKNGICSKKELINNKAQFVFNDESRLDGYPNAISTSISFPNYTCFYGMRKRSNAESDWVVILLKPSVLWEKECVFFISNAASKPAKRHFEECGSSICDLFEEESSLVPFSREQIKLPIQYTTDPQAEVMIFEKIAPDYFLSVNFNFELNKDYVNYYKYHLPDLQFLTTPQLFQPRIDAPHWERHYHQPRRQYFYG